MALNRYSTKYEMVLNGTPDRQSIKYDIKDLYWIESVKGYYEYDEVKYQADTFCFTSDKITLIKDNPAMLHEGIKMTILVVYLKEENENGN